MPMCECVLPKNQGLVLKTKWLDILWMPKFIPEVWSLLVFTALVIFGVWKLSVLDAVVQFSMAKDSECLNVVKDVPIPRNLKMGSGNVIGPQKRGNAMQQEPAKNGCCTLF